MIIETDRGFTLGDGLFETVLWAGGRFHGLKAHLDRMTAGCAVLGLPAPDRREAEAELCAAVAREGLSADRAAGRLTLTAGTGGRGLDRPQPVAPKLIATAAPAPKPTGPARLVISRVRRNEMSPSAGLKTLSYLDNVLARAEAKAAGADEAVMLNTRGQLACAAAANLFWISAGRLFTPALDCGVLAGIVRSRVLAAAEAAGLAVAEVVEGPEILAKAEGVFLTNSLIGVRQVATIGGNPVPQSRLADEISGVLDIL